ncbi:MAG: hypothetical protein V1800_12425 [Candidatus Latescibacterota bacterium]
MTADSLAGPSVLRLLEALKNTKGAGSTDATKRVGRLLQVKQRIKNDRL